LTSTSIWKILYFVPVGIAIVAIVTAELVVYIRLVRWYYQWGPIAITQRWQSRASPQKALTALETALGRSWLVWKRHGDTFAIRRPVWEPSTYPRITLTVEEGKDGAAIIYQVRPFMTTAPLLLMILLPPTTWYIAFANWFIPAYVVAGYVYFFLWESRRLREIHRVREALGDIGVHICGRCGYDLFALGEIVVCPECGASSKGLENT